jgi:NAD(P)H-hydrate epimerase
LPFRTEAGILVPAVTADQMREVDRIAVEDFGLGILQMMENAGRNLTENVLDMLQADSGEILILAGSGGNGGGGLCCARHLHNRGLQVWVILDREATVLGDAAANQVHILQMAGVPLVVEPSQVRKVVRRSALVVDALIGYGLRGSPRRRTSELIDLCNEHASRILSLDVPSGLNATTGEAPGTAVHPERTLTLALPKTGLERAPGDLYLADIGIPPEVYQRLALSFQVPFGERYWMRLGSG